MLGPARSALARALDALERGSDVVAERVGDGRPPGWAERRGWTAFLEGLGDEVLARCEALGLAATLEGLRGVPASLAALAREADERTRLPSLPPAAPLAVRRGVGARKALQLSALVAALRPMTTGARRLVDVGAGKGHLGRVASEALGREILGIERDPDRVRAALELATGSERIKVVCVDALARGILLEPGDLAVGLHACGELGDLVVRAAADARADVALVSCCLQKIRDARREALSELGRRRGAAIPREVLGLSNLAERGAGVEAPLSGILAGREHRLALRLLLRGRGVDVAHGEELRGMNRRLSSAGLDVLAARALALRGLSGPTPAELARASGEARMRWAKMRRWNLPRAMLGRLLEVALNLDRAALLEESGLSAIVVTLVPERVTARNVAIFGSADPRRLPGG